MRGERLMAAAEGSRLEAAQSVGAVGSSEERHRASAIMGSAAEATMLAEGPQLGVALHWQQSPREAEEEEER